MESLCRCPYRKKKLNPYLKIGLTEGRKNNGQKVKVKRQRAGRKWQDTNDQKKATGKKVIGKRDTEQKAMGWEKGNR